MTATVKNVRLAVTAGLSSQFPSDSLPQIALSGRSNVGKSSLLNSIAGRRALARVSGSPGKTITLNFYVFDVSVTDGVNTGNGGGLKSFYIVDLPGYGFARRPREDKEKWSMLTDSYFTAGTAGCVVQLIDLKVGPTRDDEMMLEFMNKKGIPYFIVATKSDKLNKTDRLAALSALRLNPLIPADTEIIPFSAPGDSGRDECLCEILKLAGV